LLPFKTEISVLFIAIKKFSFKEIEVFNLNLLSIFVNKKTNEALRDSEVVENIAKIYEKEGSDCWFYDDPQRFLGKKYNCRILPEMFWRRFARIHN